MYEIESTCQLPAETYRKILVDAVGEKTDGAFLDVGCWDGKQFSNTWGLARAGWRGLGIDAFPGAAQKFQQSHARPNVVGVECAIGAQDGETDLWLGGAVSSTKWDRATQAWGIPKAKTKRMHVRRLDAILDEQNWPAEYDVLSLDVEGAEIDALLGYYLPAHRPTVAIVETHEKDTSTLYVEGGYNATLHFADAYFGRHGYRKVYADKINTIYVSSRPRTAPKKRLYYSQKDEEAYIVGWFSGRVGRFLDIGAFDGVALSNTRRLAELGWGGICVEPAPKPFVALMANYRVNPNVKLVNAALSTRRGMAEFYATGDALSTFDKHHRDVWVARYGVPFQPMHLYAVTFADIAKAFPGTFEFVNLDVEGCNWELLQTIDFGRMCTELICVEYDDKLAQVREHCARFGFAPVHQTDENLILGRQCGPGTP